MNLYRICERKSIRLPAALLLCIILCLQGTVMLSASSADNGTDKAVAQTEPEDARASDSDSSQEELYHENEWNYVADSMDISGGIPDTAGGRLARIRDQGKLIVCTEPYFAPQEFIDPDLSGQDKYAGADMKLARLIADRMGVELEIVPLEFTDLLSSIGPGQYDLAISALSYTPGRASAMELSKGYHYSSEGAEVGLIIREEDSDSLTQLADIAGKDITAQAGSLQELLAAQNIKDYRQFKRLGSIQEVYDEVSEGRADAACVDIESARLYIRNNPDCHLTLMDDVVFQLEEQFEGDRIAGPKDELELMYFVNGVIDEVLASGEYEKWFAEASERAAMLGL